MPLPVVLDSHKPHGSTLDLDVHDGSKQETDLRVLTIPSLSRQHSLVLRIIIAAGQCEPRMSHPTSPVNSLHLEELTLGTHSTVAMLAIAVWSS